MFVKTIPIYTNEFITIVTKREFSQFNKCTLCVFSVKISPYDTWYIGCEDGTTGFIGEMLRESFVDLNKYKKCVSIKKIDFPL